MANKKTIIKAIAAIKTVYSYFGKDTDIELLVDTWYSLLLEYTDEEVDRGLYKALKVCKYAPVPADIIEQIESIRELKKPSETELWVQFQKALKEVLYLSHRLNYNYIDDTGISQGEQARRRIKEIWETLQPELQIYLGDSSELITAARALNYSEGLSYERNRFSKTYPVLIKRVEANRQIEETRKYLLEGF
jgi:hypothetical protein